MSSRISFFNWGISKNLLKRCWPLWTLYGLALILALPMTIVGRTRTPSPYYDLTMFNQEVLTAGTTMVYFSFAFAALAAMVMFSYLYNSRSCGMMNSLPVRRETMFTTALLTGIVPMLILNVVITGFTAAVCIPGGQTELKYLLLFFAMTSLANIAFYGFAVFCTTLTGNIIVLPAVYIVLSFTAWIAELCVRTLLSYFIYGMPSNGNTLDFLSPMVMIGTHLNVCAVSDEVTGLQIPDLYTVEGIGVLGIYAAVGVLFAAAGLLIYRKRHMETAGDIVAVPILRPVFRYCMAFGCAVVFAAIMFSSFFSYRIYGTAAAAVIAVCVCIGAFLGWFAAQMLMKKTVRVFSSGWKRLGILCVLFIALIFMGEADVFGYERSLPDVDDIKEASVLYNNSTLTQRENIERLVKAQSQIVSHKKHNEASAGYREISLGYTLTNGRYINRIYRVAADPSDVADSGSDIMLIQELINLPESILSRENRDLLSGKYRSDGGSISVDSYDGKNSSRYFELTASQASELFFECIYPDMKDGVVGKLFIVDCDECREYNTDMSVSVSFIHPDGSRGNWFGCSVPTVDCRTARWIYDNFGVTPQYLPKDNIYYYPQPTAVY